MEIFKKIVKLLLAFVITGAGITFTLMWYDWKLLLIMLLLLWGNNVGNLLNKNEDKNK